MPDRIERYSFIFAAVVQIFAVGWWISALSENVKRQDRLTEKLEFEVDRVEDKVIRLETKIESLEVYLNGYKVQPKMASGSS